MNKIYLDHAATTPIAPEVFAAMEPYLKEYYGNPSSIYTLGQQAAQAISEAREKVANAIGAKEEEIIFTGGGSNSDNTALKGAAFALKDKGRHIITSKIEHPAILSTCQQLEKYFGFDITYLDVDNEGFVDPDDVKKALRDDTILVTIMMANNEIGTIEPIKEIARIVKATGCYFHTDAVQAVGQIPIDVNELGVDMLSMSSHKINGPKGVGALYVRKGVKILPLIAGGAQERNRRAGTENVAGIVGFGKAIELAAENLEENAAYLRNLRDRLINGIENNIDDVILNGPRGEHRLPNNVNFASAILKENLFY